MVTEKMFTTEGLKGIRHIVIEVVARTDKNGAKIVGYFLGIRGLIDINTQMVNKSDLFVWLMKGDTVHMLNLGHYEIDSIIINLNGSVTKHSAYKEEVNIQRLKDVQEAMRAYDMLRPNGLIDTDKFTGVAELLKNEVENDIKPSYKSVTKTATRSSSFGTNSHVYPGTYHNKATTAYKKKETETFVIKRTTKYPISSAMGKMKIKIEAIKEGTYKAPKLAEIPADKKSKEEEKKEDKPETKTAEQLHMEEVYGYSHSAGPWLGG